MVLITGALDLEGQAGGDYNGDNLVGTSDCSALLLDFGSLTSAIRANQLLDFNQADAAGAGRFGL